MDDLSHRVQAFLDAYAGDAPTPESVVEIVGDLENDRRRLLASAVTDEERKSLIQYHSFHGRQMPDPYGAYHRERAKMWESQISAGASQK